MAFVTTVTMNISFSQSIINVWGSDDSLATVAQIKQCLYHLDIYESILLDVFFTDKVPNTNTQYYKVRINAQLNAITKRLVLAHEMIHVKQYVKQGLEIVDEQRAVWKGQTYNIMGLHHRQKPWERDASHQAGQLAKLIKHSNSIPQAIAKNQQ